jgi:hypothetical protein
LSRSGVRCPEREGYVFGFGKIDIAPLLNPNDYAMHLNGDGAENRALDLRVVDC